MSLTFGSSWTDFKRRIFINAPVELVYNSWAVQGEMEKWFLKKAQFFNQNGKPRKAGDQIQQDDGYIWQWHGWPEMDQVGQMIEVERNNILSFNFGSAGNVKLDFDAISKTRTQLILTQSNIPTDEESKKSYFYGCSLGWSFWMVNLKAFLEHGITLDEREVLLEGDERLQVVNS